MNKRLVSVFLVLVFLYTNLGISIFAQSPFVGNEWSGNPEIFQGNREPDRAVEKNPASGIVNFSVQDSITPADAYSVKAPTKDLVIHFWLNESGKPY